MATKCPECSRKFTLREALCDDWNDPEKSFGCPYCGTFFIKDMTKKSSDLTGGIAAGGIFVPATMIFSGQIFRESGDMTIAIQAGFIVLSCVAITLLNSPATGWFSPLKKSPYNQSSKTDAESAAS